MRGDVHNALVRSNDNGAARMSVMGNYQNSG